MRRAGNVVNRVKIAWTRRSLIAFVVLVLFGAACSDASSVSSSAGPEWESVAPSPLSPLYGAHAFSVGERVVVMGALDSDPCPPGADCPAPSEPPLRDGAMFDPSTGEWQPIAPAPAPLGWASAAVIGDVVYLWVPGFEGLPGTRNALLAYDAARDRWEDLPAPVVGDDLSYVLAAAGDHLVAYQSSQEWGVRPDIEYDPASGTWSELPEDPLIESFDRTMVWTDAGLVLLGIENVPQPGSEEPALYRAAVLDPETREYRRLPDSEVTGYDPSWFWAGGRLVNPTLGTSDGGEVNNWGRSYPHGGILDPVQGTWSPLPNAPPPGELFPGVAVGGERYVTSFSGWALDMATETWFELPPPPDSADEGQALTWAGDQFFVWGGVRWDGMEPAILDTGWIWDPT